MRRLDDTPLDPEIEASLDAIDATLAGEPVDPRFAELAELALMLADERPRPRPEFAASLDARVARRFAPEPAAPARLTAAGGSRRRWSRGWFVGGGFATACAGVLVALVVVLGNSGGTSENSASFASSSTASSAASTSAIGAPSAQQNLASHAAAQTKSPSVNKAVPSSGAGGLYGIP